MCFLLLSFVLFVSRDPKAGSAQNRIAKFLFLFFFARNILLCSGAALNEKLFRSHSTAKLSLDFNVLFVFRRHPRQLERLTMSETASVMSESQDKLNFRLETECQGYSSIPHSSQSGEPISRSAHTQNLLSVRSEKFYAPAFHFVRFAFRSRRKFNEKSFVSKAKLFLEWWLILRVAANILRAEIILSNRFHFVSRANGERAELVDGSTEKEVFNFQWKTRWN